jgi:hypothetical protein
MESLANFSQRTWYGRSLMYTDCKYTITFTFASAGGLRGHGEELESE